MTRLLVSAGTASVLDAEAHSAWGLNPHALIEAAGRSCAKVLSDAFPDFFKTGPGPRLTVAAGSGNNGADAMVMLRYWILTGQAEPSASCLIVSRLPKNDDASPRAELVRSLRKMDVPVLAWDPSGEDAGAGKALEILRRSDLILDGIAGTGLDGALHGSALEMAAAINALRGKPMRPFVASVDIPSGNFDTWEPGMPMVEADTTLAIEPQKYCLYNPLARPYAGVILPVDNIFPRAIFAPYNGAELLDWESASVKISKVRPDAYKNKRGTVEIHAGSSGASGAALIAARGAQAAGAGLIRIIADDEIYPILAGQAAGIMVAPASLSSGPEGRFKPDAMLLGPGWGKNPQRAEVLRSALNQERQGIPLVLDADALEFARDTIFAGNTILTPHPGEFEKFTGLERKKLLSHPAPVLLKYAEERKAVIILKGHVLTIAAPDGRLGIVDGMAPVLAAGGSGDLLAGFCAAIAARMFQEDHTFDAYTCAAAAAALLIASGKSKTLKNRFLDPLELADRAADLAGEAWLKEDYLNGRN